MFKKTAFLVASVVGILTISGCGGGQTPPPSKIEAKTIPFELRDKVLTPGWTYGPGTLTLRRAELSATVGPKVAEGQIDNAGRGNIQLPGEDQGVLAQADQGVNTALNYLFPKLFGKCLIVLNESNTGARALFVSQADFATQDGGKTLYFGHLELENQEPMLVMDMLAFVTADDTVTGDVKCAAFVPPTVNITFKRGWNLLTLKFAGTASISVKPVNTLILTQQKFGF